MRKPLPLAIALAAFLALAPAADARRADSIAPASACPRQSDLGAPARAQLKAMLCLTSYARRASGRKPLSRARPLARAAARKSADILRCDEFSHEACGREFSYWIKRFGYARGCWTAAENIGYGTGRLGTVRAIFSAWMSSPGHRANILGKFDEIGIGRRVGSLEGNRGAIVWTQDFGTRGC
ncbi:MAG: CAP domain-containing protein [Solirubrobacterales bacterium]